MPSYNPSKPSSYLINYDVNNLYGWVMYQPLSYADFRWVDDVQNEMWLYDHHIRFGNRLYSRGGCGVSATSSWAHWWAHLSFCPMREKLFGKHDDKLLATLCYKQRYIIHYCNLQLCIRHGLRIKGSTYIAIRAIFMAMRLYRTKQKI